MARIHGSVRNCVCVWMPSLRPVEPIERIPGQQIRAAISGSPRVPRIRAAVRSPPAQTAGVQLQPYPKGWGSRASRTCRYNSSGVYRRSIPTRVCSQPFHVDAVRRQLPVETLRPRLFQGNHSAMPRRFARPKMNSRSDLLSPTGSTALFWAVIRLPSAVRPVAVIENQVTLQEAGGRQNDIGDLGR